MNSTSDTKKRLKVDTSRGVNLLNIGDLDSIDVESDESTVTIRIKGTNKVQPGFVVEKK